MSHLQKKSKEYDERTILIVNGYIRNIQKLMTYWTIPTEIIDQVGGWADYKVGSSYGNGYSLKIKRQELCKIVNF